MEDSDGGVLFGLWSPEEKDYADGTDPTAWSGSSAILEEFWETKRAVRYGQCWVFGGLLTTGKSYSDLGIMTVLLLLCNM